MRLPTKRARVCSSRLTGPMARGASIAPGAGSCWPEPGHLLESIRISLRCFPRSARHATGGASFSRYACVCRPGLDDPLAQAACSPSRYRPQAERAELLLLPWPLRVREPDFRAVEGSVKRLAKEPFGFFEFAPRGAARSGSRRPHLLAARDEVGSVDVVVLPESAVEESESARWKRCWTATG